MIHKKEREGTVSLDSEFLDEAVTDELQRLGAIKGDESVHVTDVEIDGLLYYFDVDIYRTLQN